jgi:hypothetical protein
MHLYIWKPRIILWMQQNGIMNAQAARRTGQCFSLTARAVSWTASSVPSDLAFRMCLPIFPHDVNPIHTMGVWGINIIIFTPKNKPFDTLWQVLYFTWHTGNTEYCNHFNSYHASRLKHNSCDDS